MKGSRTIVSFQIRYNESERSSEEEEAKKRQTHLYIHRFWFDMSLTNHKCIALYSSFKIKCEKTGKKLGHS